MSYSPSDYCVETASGRFLDLSNPDPTTIDLGDIAQGLALTCRYGGQTKLSGGSRRFYSVAEHARLVAWRLSEQGAPPEVQLAGLHHDDGEAYVGDHTRPLKCLVPALKEVEERVFAAVVEALGIAHLPFYDARVKWADDWALSAEAWHLMESKGASWWSAGLYFPPDGAIGAGASWEVAERLWLEHHYVLCERLGLVEVTP